MRLKSTKSLQAGDILGKTITNSTGRVLLSKGMPLSETFIDRILNSGINYVYVQDEDLGELHFEDAIPDPVRFAAIETIEETFEEVKKDISNNQSLVIERASKQLTSIVRNLIDEIKNNEEIITLISDVYMYDNYIFTHSLNVSLYSIAIGRQLSLKERDLEELGLGALLHDVGKMKIPSEILNKPSHLSDSEFAEMKKHSMYGFQILKEVNTLSLMVAHCALQHHERIDGSGYPRNIKGGEMHLWAKIIAVADVYDAVTSNRVYRKAMLPHEGLEVLYAGAGTLFDSDIVNAFKQTIAIYPVGMKVVLNDGSSGVVVKQNQTSTDRPIIKVHEKNGRKVESFELDLMKHLNIVITDCEL